MALVLHVELSALQEREIHHGGLEVILDENLRHFILQEEEYGLALDCLKSALLFEVLILVEIGGKTEDKYIVVLKTTGIYGRGHLLLNVPLENEIDEGGFDDQSVGEEGVLGLEIQKLQRVSIDFPSAIEVPSEESFLLADCFSPGEI